MVQNFFFAIMELGWCAVKQKASGWFWRIWWVVAVCAIALLAFGHAMKDRIAAIAQLRFRLSEMEYVGALVNLEKEELALQIASQSDPAWVELVLLREVGVVPEGFLKVHFANNPTSQ